MTRMTQRQMRLGLLATLAVAATLTVPGWSAHAGNANPRILPPNSQAFGKTYGEWSVEWWRFVLSQPPATNPLFDTTGADCAIGQSGSVFFLVGAAGSGTPTRDDCMVPAGKA